MSSETATTGLPSASKNNAPGCPLISTIAGLLPLLALWAATGLRRANRTM